ncbi:serine/threonine-protein kinase [Phytohabitans houttuyneae]|uniref:non-specific serine/threonine protein kinase n=1 Tax=Phytohabitans houttuyneae TaxID=1076126 RepID=A0A6V8K6E1_9ACTN|nr:serine/threonine-protein kinase [Phytohabitans houttuyneae]GFJ79090.1 serine/threonine protein kinase [Phytohabitans houttuyneae]
MTVLGGRYRLDERLGAGGMAVVWRAYDEVLDRPVAVKVLAPRHATDPSFRWQLRAEAQAAGKLCHPHITNVYDYGEQDGAPYIVMELIDGQPMAAALDHDGPMPWPEAVKACSDVASALAVAHAHGVVHRDVKPSNVMLTPSGAKVVDFGISALIGANDVTPEGSLLGTPAYLAPERMEGGQVSPATDVYALGLLLYRALTGHLPWEVATTTQMLRAHRYKDPGPLPPVDGLPEAVALLCRRCLSKQPRMRPSAAEAASVLAAFSSPSWLPVAAPAVQSRGRQLAAAVLAASALLAVTGGLWVTGNRNPAGTAGTGAAAAAALPATTAQTSTACSVTYALKRDSGREFHADLTVTNAGGHPVEGWRLTFAFPGDQRLVGARAAKFAQSGRNVVIQPPREQPIAAGDSVAVGVTGRYEKGNPLPTTFAVDGTECEALVSGASQPVTSPRTAAKPAKPPKPTDDKAPAKDSSGKGKGGGEDKSGKGGGGDEDDD